MEWKLYNQDTIFGGGRWRVQREATKKFSWHGGSCSSETVLTVSLRGNPHVKEAFLDKMTRNYSRGQNCEL